MTYIDLEHLNNLDLHHQELKLMKFNQLWTTLNIDERISWIFKNLPENIVMSSSFGLHSVVLLHLIIRQKPDIPVILIDTGYLFSETYKYIDLLTDLFNLNLKVFRSKISVAWQESRYGKLWEKGRSGIEQYNMMNKVLPMKQALSELKVKTWLSGLRHNQSKFRSSLQYFSIQNNILKVLPILDWSFEKIDQYMSNNNLLYHPLWNKGYISLGDIHTTHKYISGMLPEETRFFGFQRECGLHNK